MTIPDDVLEITQGAGEPRYGVILKLHISDPLFQTEMQVAVPTTSDATVPQTTSATRLAIKSPGINTHTHFRPNDTSTLHYRARHILPGYCSGSFSDFVCGKAVELSRQGTPIGDRGGGAGGQSGGSGGGGGGYEVQWRDEGRRQSDTVIEEDGIFRNTVTVRDTGGDFGINRHTESDVGQHSSAQTFTNAFEAPPTVVFIPQKGKVTSDSAALTTKAQFIDLAAEDLTVSGFTMRAVIASSAAATTINDGFSAAQNAADPENGDVSLSVDGAVAFSNLEGADAGSAVTYEAAYDVDTVPMNALNLLTVEFGFNANATSTSFTVGASRNYNQGVNLTNEKLNFLTALGVDFDVRLRIAYSSDPGVEVADVTAHGENNAVPGVQYTKITAGTEESMTPLTGQGILWQATEAP